MDLCTIQLRHGWGKFPRELNMLAGRWTNFGIWKSLKHIPEVQTEIAKAEVLTADTIREIEILDRMYSRLEEQCNEARLSCGSPTAEKLRIGFSKFLRRLFDTSWEPMVEKWRAEDAAMRTQRNRELEKHDTTLQKVYEVKTGIRHLRQLIVKSREIRPNRSQKTRRRVLRKDGRDGSRIKWLHRECKLYQSLKLSDTVCSVDGMSNFKGNLGTQEIENTPSKVIKRI